MSRIKEKFLRFTPAPNDGASKYLVYILQTGTPFDYDAPSHDVGMETSGISLSQWISSEGNYDIYVVAEDDSGNMSDETAIVTNYPFDLTPPLPVVGGDVY